MKVLLIGGGGREHAIAWALSRSPRLSVLRCAPGNAGIRRHAECIDLSATDLDGLVRHALAERYDLVVVGPEAPLVAGLADRLRAEGIAVFGPSAAAAEIEGSKIFSKQFMQRHGIPTAAFEVFDDLDAATSHLESPGTVYPLVVKADGLAAGKGVVLCDGAGAAVAAAGSMLSGTAFGEAGSRILVEELLRGRETSFFVLADGREFVELATCQDYKRVGNGDVGPNTGGMGTYSPSVYIDEATREGVVERIVRPTIAGLAAEDRPYHGVLYVGVMLTAQGPRVLEYNARFGDPETQVLMPRLDGDWLELLHAAAVGRLAGVAPRWTRQSAVCVVMASAGYPGSYDTGVPIEGLDALENGEDALVFHAGTRREPGEAYTTAGGRVLGVSALGVNLAEARRRAYAAVDRIRWSGEHHRDDIALDAMNQTGGLKP